MSSLPERLDFEWVAGNPSPSEPRSSSKILAEQLVVQESSFGYLPGLFGGSAVPGNPKRSGAKSVFGSWAEQTGFESAKIIYGNVPSNVLGANYVHVPLQVANFQLEEPYHQRHDLDLVVLSLQRGIQTLLTNVANLHSEIEQLRRSQRFVVPLATLAPYPFDLKGPIPVTIEQDGGEFTATFIEANVSATGETEADAIENFKDSLLSSYSILAEMSAERLRPLPSRQWAILKDLIQRAK